MSPSFRTPTSPPRARTDRGRGVPGTGEVKVAAFRSAVSDAIGGAVGLPVAVIAVTDDPEGLARHLTENWHAAWSASPGGHPAAFVHDPFTSSDVAYAMSPMDAGWLRGDPLPSGISLEEGTLRVSLPAGSTADDLGPLFEIAMSDLRFDVLAGQPTHVARRHAAGHPVSVVQRYSRSPGASLRSVTLVRDLYGFRPRDLSDVAAALALAAEGLAVRLELARSSPPTFEGKSVGR